MAAMAEGNITASIGAHHHAGLDVHSDKQRYIVCRALCESPHPFSLFEIDTASHQITFSEVALG